MDFPIAELMDEDACYAKLLHWLHPDGLACPRCGARDGLGVHRRHRAPILDYRCKACHRVFNAFTGTALQGTRRPVVELMLILRGFAQGVPTAQLARELGCDRKELLGCATGSSTPPGGTGTSPGWTTRWRRPTRCTRTRGKKGVPHPDPLRPAAAAGEQGPRPRHLGQRPAAGLRGGGPRQRPAPAVGRAARRRRDVEPGGA